MTSRLTRVYGWLALLTARRGGLVTNALFVSIVIAMIVATLAFLWRAALPGDDRIAGYDLVQMTWYIAVAQSAVASVDARMVQRIGEALRSGELTTDLLRPAPVAGVIMARELGTAMLRGYLVLPAAALVAWLVVGPPPSWAGFAVALITMPLAATAHVALLVAVSAAALWLGDTTAVWMVVQKTVFLAGGMLIPLETWPGATSDVLAALPFAAMAYTPARLAVFPDAGDAARLIALQLVWIALLGGVVAWAWSRGLRRVMQVAT